MNNKNKVARNSYIPVPPTNFKTNGVFLRNEKKAFLLNTEQYMCETKIINFSIIMNEINDDFKKAKFEKEKADQVRFNQLNGFSFEEKYNIVICARRVLDNKIKQHNKKIFAKWLKDYSHNSKYI